MKKRYLLILLLFSFSFVITGCASSKTKEVGTLTDFEVKGANENFLINDNMSEYKDVNYVIDAKKAVLNDITVQMVVYDNNENAQKVHDSHIETFMTMKSSGTVINKDKGKNYYHFDMVSNGYYMISSRIDNTLIFVKTPVENKTIVNELFNNLGY